MAVYSGILVLLASCGLIQDLQLASMAVRVVCDRGVKDVLGQVEHTQQVEDLSRHALGAVLDLYEGWKKLVRIRTQLEEQS